MAIGLATSAPSKLQKAGFALWLCALLLCGTLLSLKLGQGYVFDSSILALLPDSEHSEAAAIAQQRLIDTADKRLIFLLKDSDKSRSINAAMSLEQSLKASGVFKQVLGKTYATDTQAWKNFYFPHRYNLLSNESYSRLAISDPLLIDESLQRLYSPLASIISSQLLSDPLQLFMQWQMSVMPKLAFKLEDNWLTRNFSDHHFRLLTAELNNNPYADNYQQQVASAIALASKALPAESKLYTSGMILHATHGAAQAKHEISTIGMGSALGILCLLLLVFRRITIVALAFIPIAMGCLFALTMSVLVFDSVHLVTLAFGAGLVGVAIDYALHYLCASFEPASTAIAERRTVLQRILPSLTLGLVTSVLAYTAQGMAPFPGLRQMAFFSACGLVGAWLTVVCWLPILYPKLKPSINPTTLYSLSKALSFWPNIATFKVKFIFLTLAAALITVVLNIQPRDDLHLLSTSSNELIQQDRFVYGLLNSANAGQYFIINAESEQALLEREENLSLHLNLAIEKKWITSAMASSQFIPSNKRQHENHLLMTDKVFQPDGLLHQLAKQGGFPSIEQAARLEFLSATSNELSIENWLQSDVSSFAKHLWIGEREQHYYSLTTITGVSGATAIEQLSTMAASLEGVEFIDRVGTISKLLNQYRSHLVQWLLLAYGLVTALLMLRYGLKTWRVIAAPGLASLVALSCVYLNGSPVTIFHILALLLVLGIGLDASIFLQDTHNNVYALLAVILSSLTTLMAFGLLALSATPVLHFFGETVLPGILCVLFFAPCFVERTTTTHKL